MNSLLFLLNLMVKQTIPDDQHRFARDVLSNVDPVTIIFTGVTNETEIFWKFLTTFFPPSTSAVALHALS